MNKDDYKPEPRPALRFLSLNYRNPLVGAEIGVFRAHNAQRYLDNLNIKKLYLIDPYISCPNGYSGSVYRCVKMTPNEVKELAEKRMEPYKDKIEWIRKPSPQGLEDVTEPLDFIYIDGDHLYKAVCKDVEVSLPLVRTGGVISGHDAHRGTVRKAVEGVLGDHYIHYSGSDWWCIKGAMK